MARTEEEDFKIIKIDVKIISLNNIVSNHFGENNETFVMKYSECWPPIVP